MTDLCFRMYTYISTSTFMVIYNIYICNIKYKRTACLGNLKQNAHIIVVK